MCAMTSTAAHESPFAQARRRLWVGRAVTLAILAVAAILLWHFAGQHAVMMRKEESISVLMAVAPPPPPPPPPPRPPREEVIKQTVPMPVPQSVQPPPPTPQAVARNETITENAPAQEGTDDFQIAAGSGGGMRGSGGSLAAAFNRGAYASYLAQIVQRAIQANAALRSLTFRVKVSVWLSAAGKFTRAQLRSSTGSPAGDRQLESLLESLPAAEQLPPQSVLDDLPVQMTVEIGRSL
jgi:outer membrane biosynthesis protein TonB